MLHEVQEMGRKSARRIEELVVWVAIQMLVLDGGICQSTSLAMRAVSKMSA